LTGEARGDAPGCMCEDRAMARRTTRRLALAGAAGLLVAVLGAAAALGARGNANAASFYARSRAAMAGYEGISFRGGGTSYAVAPQRGGYDSFRFDFGAAPAGYRKSVDHVRVVQAHGVVREEVDTLVAHGLPALRVWQTGVLEVGEVMTAHPCPEIVPKNNASYVTVGRPFVVFSGRYRYAKLGRRGRGAHALRVVRTTYPLAGGTAHEKDQISARTRLWHHSHLIVRGGPYNANFLSESHFTYRRVARYEAPPPIGHCG
jgi:hypothetical protein